MFSEIFIPEQNKTIVESINYSVNANDGVGECFRRDGCARCVSTVLCRSGYNPDIYNQSVSYLLYQSLINLPGGKFIIDNNPDTKGSDLFVEPSNVVETNLRVRPGDVIGWRGGSTSYGQGYRTHQPASHIGLIHNTIYDGSWVIAHNEQDTSIVGSGRLGTISLKTRTVSKHRIISGKQHGSFMTRANPFVFRMPPILDTWDDVTAKLIQKKNRQYTKENRSTFAHFTPSLITIDKYLNVYDYDYEYAESPI